MKKIVCLALACLLALGLAVPALAAGEGAELDWTYYGNGEEIPAAYAALVTVNGEELDTAGLPGAPAGYVPIRLVTEADGGFVDYYPEDNSGFVRLDNNSIEISFADCSLSLEWEPVEDAKAYFDPAGYTFLPVSFLDDLETVSVTVTEEGGVERYAITTSSSDPMVKLVKSIEEAGGVSLTPVMAEMLEYLEFDMANYEQLVAHAPMMNVNSDVVFVAKVAEGKMEEAKANFQAMYDHQYASFEHYLANQFAKVQAGKIVESPDGQHLLLVISADPDAGIALFNAAYPA